MSILEVKDLELDKEDTQILDGVDLELKEGEVQALVGPNGAGKSSLAFAIMGLQEYRDVSGEIIYRGEPIEDFDISERAERGISLAWQEPARYEGLKVRKFINSAADGDSVAADVLEKVGMDPDRYLDRAVDSSLSGGERKKVEMASILAMQPDLVLLDEPDSGIDVASLDKIFESIDLLKENGTTVVLITHSATALSQAEYAYLMCCGSVVDEGPVDEVGEYFEEKCIPCDHKNRPDLNEEIE